MAAKCVWALILLRCLLAVTVILTARYKINNSECRVDPTIRIPAVSGQTTSSLNVDNDQPKIWISQSNKADPTQFVIDCYDGQQWSGGSTVISLEVSLLPDKQPSVFSPYGITSQPSTWRQIAHLDRLSSNKTTRVNPNLAEKGVSGRTNTLSVSFNAGTCEDTGLYRCKAVYLPANQTTFNVKFSEARLPACLPGAVAQPTDLWPPYQRYENNIMRSNFACYVNSSLVVELVSLEVSVVRNGSRVVLAYINSYLNDAKVSYSSGDVQVAGSIYPLSPERSSLSVTQVLDQSEEKALYTTTCKAVYSGKNISDNPIVSMADGKMWFRK